MREMFISQYLAKIGFVILKKTMMDLLFLGIGRKRMSKIQGLSLLSFVMSLPSLFSICWAGNLALNGSSTWGWFLGVGCVLALAPIGVVSKEQQASDKIKRQINEG